MDPTPSTRSTPPAKRSTPLGVGDPIPDVTLPDQHGTPRSLRAMLGRPLVVYFYPADNTPACTLEACTFRDEFEHFCGLNAEVIGISSDSVDSHAAFAKRFNLPFVLLADIDGVARAAFAVPKTLGLFPGRVTYVVDSSGIVRHIITSAINAKRHVREALKSIAQPT